MLTEDLQVDFRQDASVGSERGRDILVADEELDGSLEQPFELLAFHELA